MSGFCVCRILHRIGHRAQNMGSCAELRKIYQMAQEMRKFCWFLLTLSLTTVKITQYTTCCYLFFTYVNNLLLVCVSWTITGQPQNSFFICRVAKISRHSVFSGDRIRQCGMSCSIEEVYSVGHINNVETYYFTQLKICYLMTTFWCPSDVLITSWLFTARWSIELSLSLGNIFSVV